VVTAFGDAWTETTVVLSTSIPEAVMNSALRNFFVNFNIILFDN